MDKKPLTREAAQARLVEKAMQDPAFRAELLSDPRAVIGKEFGMPIPANVTIEVLAETPAHYYVVLPALQPDVDDLELDDETLETVAGGGVSVCRGKES